MASTFEEFRMGHLVRTAAMWKRMCELGASEATLLDMDFVFSAPDQDSVDSIRHELSTYSIAVEREEPPNAGFSVTGTTGAIAWNEAQLLKWVDYLIQVGHDAGCQFEGCGARIGDGAI